MLLNSHNSERSNRRFALHTWSGGTNKSKPVKVLSGVLSTYCSNCPHQTHIYHRWCTVKIHSRCSRRWFSSGLIEKSKSLKLKIKIPPTPTPDLNSLQKNEVSTHTWTRTYARAFQDGDSGLCPGTTREDRSPPVSPWKGPCPLPPPARQPSPPEQHKARQAATPFTWHSPVVRALVWGLTADTWPPLRRGGTNSLNGFSFSMASEKRAGLRANTSRRAR